ncbi:MAG: hypothetical protein AAGK74_00960 [Chloroflexota bacterium]
MRILDRHRDTLPAWLAEWTLLAHLPAGLKTELGKRVYAEQWAIGASLSPKNAFDYITGWSDVN